MFLLSKIHGVWLRACCSRWEKPGFKYVLFYVLTVHLGASYWDEFCLSFLLCKVDIMLFALHGDYKDKKKWRLVCIFDKWPNARVIQILGWAFLFHVVVRVGSFRLVLYHARTQGKSWAQCIPSRVIPLSTIPKGRGGKEHEGPCPRMMEWAPKCTKLFTLHWQELRHMAHSRQRGWEVPSQNSTQWKQKGREELDISWYYWATKSTWICLPTSCKPAVKSASFGVQPGHQDFLNLFKGL